MSDNENEASNSEKEISILERTPVRTKRISESALSSLEKMDHSPPDLWQNKKSITMNTPINSSPPSWTKGLSQTDLNDMHQLGCLSTSGIFNEIIKIYYKAYQLGVVESTEIRRGKLLGVFSNAKKKSN